MRLPQLWEILQRDCSVSSRRVTKSTSVRKRLEKLESATAGRRAAAVRRSVPARAPIGRWGVRAPAPAQWSLRTAHPAVPSWVRGLSSDRAAAGKRTGEGTVGVACSLQQGLGHPPGLRNPSNPRIPHRPARERPRSRRRSTRCRRRHGCHDGSEVSLRATAAGARAWCPGSPVAPTWGSATRRTPDSLGFAAVYLQLRPASFKTERRGVAPGLWPRQRERWRTRPSATSK